MRQDQAETIALKALGWLATNDELLPVFLGSTGSDVEKLRDGAGDPAFLGGLLDFICMDDQWVIEFCDTEGLAYDTPMRARAALPGGGEMHWT